MRVARTAAFLLLGFGSAGNSLAQSPATVTVRELQPLIGHWQGSLTYLDYSSGKPYTMPADINIQQIGRSNRFRRAYSYPKEASANSVDTLTVSADGRLLDQEPIKTKRRLPGGNLEIVTETAGTDGNDNQPALIRHTYVIGRDVYTSRKDVQFAGQTTWLKRHEYSYTRSATGR
ncbi:hypothetical protein F0P96_11805 [Hymenobacter busanensis]|uniref:Uncharacterized protein n=1 Tax=Hymenobacter busanensis TaxID=2607656 RepID=A0A7L4ZXC5_9BACT|nr:hypothetical protein [Hymenobacter busanensis]KAA9332165.1 hypothetical protein F0P96_11805 [Hymenobacter busanensis]QHJ07496.1 hypothetical protein GUY19_09465 [Hymenobacter busanensis]